MAAKGSSPAQLVLTASVARRYYLEGKTKVEIADEMAMSRFKVARLLDAARSSGLVRIEIAHSGEIDVALSADLRDAYQLQNAIVVDTMEEDAAALRGHVGGAAAELLTEIVTADDVLGLGWARSLIAMCAQLRAMAPCEVVQLTGALTQADVDNSSIDLVRDVARIAGGPAYFFYAPMIVPDAATASLLLRQPEVARAMARFKSVTKAVVGIGGWRPAYSTVHAAISPEDRRALAKLGVCADISGVLIDGDGAPVNAALRERIIGIDAPQLLEVPEVIALAYAPEKATAARAALRGGFITSMVTHTSFARALIDAR
uniref:Transcriptional regulator n=1 Tax=uncultured Nocardioidaceae bacterium TaxID=253824 RepID=A0A6J4KQF0_9ACTN|nr:MAG: Transcriptional regulator [uncultured Nocardioidaceae bacterium]